MITKEALVAMIDYTLLKPTATKADIEAFCQETIRYGFKTIFVNPYYVSLARQLLIETSAKIGVPIGFSLGGATTKTKVAEVTDSIANGAGEIDMLINLGALKSQEYAVVKQDIAEVVKAAQGLTIKVIIETALLTKDEKITACELIMEAGADYVKTATGFNGGGATVEDVKLLKAVVGDQIGIKAAGGIRCFEDAALMVNAGASRIGTSSAIQIVLGQKVNSIY